MKRLRPFPVRPLRRLLPLQLVVPAAIAVTACGGEPERGSSPAAAAAPRSGAEVAEDTQEQPRADMAVLQVFAEMREDSLTRGRDISVRNADSRLILTGRVRTEAVRQRALAIVHERLGSLTLVDSLVVDPAAPDPAARDGA